MEVKNYNIKLIFHEIQLGRFGLVYFSFPSTISARCDFGDAAGPINMGENPLEDNFLLHLTNEMSLKSRKQSTNSARNPISGYNAAFRKYFISKLGDATKLSLFLYHHLFWSHITSEEGTMEKTLPYPKQCGKKYVVIWFDSVGIKYFSQF